MKTSASGIELIKRFESLRLVAYRDQAGIWTIGWGHTRNVKRGDVITLERAEALFAEDLAIAEDDVLSGLEVPVTQSQFNALVAFVFNVGRSVYRTSTLLKLLNAGHPDLAGKQLMRWVYAGTPGAKKVSNGLVSRRKAETEMWLSETD